MKRSILSLAAGLMAIFVEAQVPITSGNLSYVQDFNTLDTIGTNLTALPPHWSFSEWGGSTANSFYRASAGSATAGGTYSFGAPGSADRAIGSICSSGMPQVSYGVRFVNLSSGFINFMTVSFEGGRWRRGGTGNTDSIRFYFSTARGRSIADTSFTTWTEVPSLLFQSVTTASPASAINGNDSARLISAKVPCSIPPGDTMSIRWYDYNSGGNDDGLAIDSLTVNFTIGPPPPPVVPLIVALSPAPQSNGVLPGTDLKISFDRYISAGTGNIYVKDRSSGLQQTIGASSGAVYISGKDATVGGVISNPSTEYHVTFDSLAFDTAGVPCSGLYDTTAWVIRTASSQTGVPQTSPEKYSVVNPARHGLLLIASDNSSAKHLETVVTDLAGRCLFRQYRMLHPGSNHLRISSGLSSGLYLLELRDGYATSRHKILIE